MKKQKILIFFVFNTFLSGVLLPISLVLTDGAMLQRDSVEWQQVSREAISGADTSVPDVSAANSDAASDTVAGVHRFEDYRYGFYGSKLRIQHLHSPKEEP